MKKADTGSNGRFPKVRLMALDLDGTLLNSEKELSRGNRRALEAAAERGIEIVPSTGRFYRGIPEEIRALPFVHRAITINGAHVVDLDTGETIYSGVIPNERAAEVLSWLDTQPVIYDCYLDGWGYVTASMQNSAEDYIDYPPSLAMLRELRSPVPELKAFLREKGLGAQKLQLFTRDMALRERLLRELKVRFPELLYTASLPNNIEINAKEADKGQALLALSDYLDIPRASTMAFGDGTNDLAMLLAAGTGVAMGNAHPDVKAAADIITGDCDSDGVAQVVWEVLDRMG